MSANGSANSSTSTVQGEQRAATNTYAQDPRLAAHAHGTSLPRCLHIVLDLDHTLVNASEHELSRQPLSAGRPLHSFELGSTESGAPRPHYLLGLRDGLDSFLQEIEQLATLHVYTMGSKSYATEVLKIIDPQHNFIKGRMMCRSDEAESFIKSLEHLGWDAETQRGSLVLDDRVQACGP